MVVGFSSFGSFAATTLFALQQQQHPASNIVKRVKSIYRDLEPCNVTSFSYQRGAIQFSHVFPSQEARDELSAKISQSNNSKSFLFHQIASSHGYTKPLLVYLPGMDAAGISAYTQFPSLADSFELWRMTVDKDDCITTFLDLTNAAVSFINDMVSATANDRPVVLVGESFGGLLAPSVALRVQHKLSGLVLVNPATSFDQTQWTSLLPVVASVGQQKQPPNTERRSSFTSASRSEPNDGIAPTRFPTPYSLLGGLILSLTIPDQKQFGQIINLVRNVPVRNQEDLNDVLKSLADGFHILQDRLPEATVTHRIRQWLAVGTQVINPRLGELRVKTVIVAGNEDKMLPTKQESTRLLSIIPNSTKIELRNSGHFTLDDRVNLTHMILEESNIFPKKKTFDPILDWTPPTMEYTKERIEEVIKPLRLLTGPVFFSTDEKGIRHRGLGLIPPKNGGPILFVANHQFGKNVNSSL
jgi:pimeloyl-ACP methyl ester carboxylesterase